MSQLELERVAPSHAVAAALIRELDDELGTRYPRDKIHGLHPDELIAFPGICSTSGRATSRLRPMGYIGNTYSLCYEKSLTP